jgi:GNAT superfamily N-acetyltransferase
MELTTDWIYLLKNNPDKLQTFKDIVQEVGQLPYRRFQLAVVGRSLTQPLPAIQPRLRLDIRPFEAGDLEAVRQINRPSEAQLCARRLEAGHKGLSAFHEGQLVGYNWGCFEIDMDLERVYIELEPADYFSVDNYTSPFARRKGVQTALLLAQFRLFRDLGCNRAMAYIRTDNLPSLAVWRKLGSKVISYIDFTRLGPWRRAQHQMDHPRVDNGAYPSSRLH